MRFAVTLASATIAAIMVVSAAHATTYDFVQTGSNTPYPSLIVHASIEIDGTLADLPTICNQGTSHGCGSSGSLPPYDFGALQSFSINFGIPYSLSNFTAACTDLNSCIPGLPGWNISPNGIQFIDSRDESDFDIDGFAPTSTIVFNSDFLVGACPLSGQCIVTGIWDPVPAPEPASILLLVGALAAAAVSSTAATASRRA